MSVVDFAAHLLHFLLPALALAVLLEVSSRLFLRAKLSRKRVILNTLFGSLVLMAGLVVFNNDGKMATYAALVFVSATCQWWMLRRR